MIRFVILLLFACNLCVCQNVYLEIQDWHKKFDNETYSMYQFADASYSSSRSTLIIITSKDVLVTLSQFFPQTRGKKKEYSDVWILGFVEADLKNLSQVEQQIIELFYKQILKYRQDNNLAQYIRSRLDDLTIFISNANEICSHFNCNGKKL